MFIQAVADTVVADDADTDEFDAAEERVTEPTDAELCILRQLNASDQGRLGEVNVEYDGPDRDNVLDHLATTGLITDHSEGGYSITDFGRSFLRDADSG